MKSYKHLYEDLISTENIWAAMYFATHGHMKRKIFKNMKENPDKYVERVRNWIIHYQPQQHTPKIINDGISMKQREIIVPTTVEHVVQHAVMVVLKPIFMRGMYEHSYASIPRRGCHNGMKTVKKWTQKKRNKNVKYCLKIDIRKYFDSISQDILIEKLSKKIHDEKFMELLIKIIKTTDHGIPLGFYTSQWFANFYLQDFDHFVKEQLHIKHYIRYMDDMVFFGSNKRKLHTAFDRIKEYLRQNLCLEIKDNWQLFLFDDGNGRGRFLDFMGFRFYRNRVTLRRRMTMKAMRKANKLYKKTSITVLDAQQMLTYKGWTLCTDTYNWLKNYILSKISFSALRKLISRSNLKRRLAYVV